MQEDRQRWNERWSQRASEPFPQPSQWLVDVLPTLPIPAHAEQRFAIDVACGRGRNALLLAEQGWQVAAVDISEAGIASGRAEALRRGLTVDWQCHDLDGWCGPASAPALVLMFRYTDADLLRRLAARLAPGGVLVSEQHLDRPGDGPRDPRFRWLPGALRTVASGLRVCRYDEVDDDGRPLCRLIAERPVG